MAGPLARLKRRADFLRVAAERRKWVAPGVIVQAAPAGRGKGFAEVAEATEVRVGFTCSRKVGNSVARNRARRRLREAARLVMPERVKPGTDYVLIGRQDTLTRPFDLLLGDLRTALDRLAHGRPRESRPESRPRHEGRPA